MQVWPFLSTFQQNLFIRVSAFKKSYISALKCELGQLSSSNDRKVIPKTLQVLLKFYKFTYMGQILTHPRFQAR